jgi:hypothetical protein
MKRLLKLHKSYVPYYRVQWVDDHKWSEDLNTLLHILINTERMKNAFLFIYVLFKDTGSSSGYAASNDGMIHEQ